MFPRTVFRFTKGEPKRFRSSKIIEKCFCPGCGSTLTDQYLVTVSGPHGPDNVFVHLGTLDEPEAVPITEHMGVDSQLSWVCFDDGLPRMRCDEGPALAAAFAAAENG